MSVKERQEREKKARKKAILDAAQKVFSKDGFERASVDEIAALSELSVGTLYLYFKSKEEMYASLLLESIELFTKKLERIGKLRCAPREKVKRMWDFFYPFYRQKPELFHIVMFLSLPNVQGALSDKLKQEINRSSGRNFAALAQILREAECQCAVSEAAYRRQAEVLWASFLGMVTFARSREHLGLPTEIKSLHRAAWQLLERSLFPV